MRLPASSTLPKAKRKDSGRKARHTGPKRGQPIRNNCNSTWKVRTSKACSSNNVLDDMAMDVGKTAPHSIVIKGQFFVIHAEQVQNGGMEIVSGSRVLGHLK